MRGPMRGGLGSMIQVLRKARRQGAAYLFHTHNQYAVLWFNPVDRARLRPALLALLVEVDRFMKEVRVPYWLDCGTLLGAIRHGGFIPWDDDVDIAVEHCHHRHLLTHRDRLDDRYRLIELSWFWPYDKLVRPLSVIKRDTFLRCVDTETGAFVDIFEYSDRHRVAAETPALEELSEPSPHMLMLPWEWRQLHHQRGPLRLGRFLRSDIFAEADDEPAPDADPDTIVVEDYDGRRLRFGVCRSFEGLTLELCVPLHASNVLVGYYGDDWHIPRRD